MGRRHQETSGEQKEAGLDEKVYEEVHETIAETKNDAWTRHV
jgi:hypothetical protein